MRRNPKRKRASLIIEGSRTFRIWVNGGLELLQTKAPQWYDFVINATRKIRELPPGAGVHVQSQTHETAWDSKDYPSALKIFTIAREMAHEACHIYRYLAGNPEWNPAEPRHSERECVEKELEVGQIIDLYNRFGRHGHWRQILANIRNPATWWWD